jgi:glycosyltransferase involved in cell wall biosynthesis
MGKNVADLDPDCVLLHWLGDRTLSVREVTELSGKRVWYAHDLWIAQLMHHLPSDEVLRGRLVKRAIVNFLSAKKVRLVDALDSVVVPSAAMAEIVQRSAITRDLPVEIVPPPLNTERWRPLDKDSARAALGLPTDKFIAMFSAAGGLEVPWKGGRYFVEACEIAAERGLALLPLIVGAPCRHQEFSMEHVCLGRLNSVAELQLAYAASDVVVCPSSFESFSQTASEAHAMGRPVIAFSGSGLSSVVEDEVTGFLVGHSVEALASRIVECGLSSELREHMASNARIRATRLWSYQVVAPQLFSALFGSPK